MTTSTTEIQRLSNLTASERAAERNVKTREWIAAGPDRWAGLLSEDDEWWAKVGVSTGLDLERYFLASEISDTYKERHGIRPRFYDFPAMSLTDMENVLDSLVPTAEELAEQKAEWDAEEAYWKAREALDAAEAEWDASLNAAETKRVKEDAQWAEQDRLEGVYVRA